jgi:hypothetical protein
MDPERRSSQREQRKSQGSIHSKIILIQPNALSLENLADRPEADPGAPL